MVSVTAGEVSPIGRDRLLRRDRDMPGDLRRATRAGVDGGAGPLVRRPAGAGPLPRAVPGAPGRDHAAARSLARGGRGGEQACELLSRPPGHPAVGRAFYQSAELHRLRGDVAAAEQAYRQAERWGHEAQPGLALLRLARVLMARAYRELGDPSCAEMELDAGCWVFEQLGAMPDVVRPRRFRARDRPTAAS